MTDLHMASAAGPSQRRWPSMLQASLLTECREIWAAVGLCSKPADRTRAEHAIRMMYRASDLPAPRLVWCGSPLWLLTAYSSVALEVSLDTRHGNVGSLSRVLRGSIGQAMLSGLKEAISPETFHSAVRWLDLRRLLSSVRRSVLQQALDSFDSLQVARAPGSSQSRAAALSWSAARSVWYRVMARDWERELLFGQHDADWLALLDYFRGICGWGERSEALTGLAELARSAGWVLPCARVCYISERPSVVRCDDAGRLHCASGPAVVYPDGWELHFWHGVSVRAEWLERGETLDPRFIVGWWQAEQRSALAEIAGGWHRVVERLPTRILDEDPDRAIGTLFECSLPDRTARFLRVLCGTGRTFVLPVHRECRTAREANAWTYGLDAAEYAPEIRT